LCHVPGVRSRFTLLIAVIASMASACSTASSGPGPSDANDEFPSCNGACEAGTTCQGYSPEGYCAEYYCAQGAWAPAMGCPSGMTQTPSLTTSCGQGCFGMSICTYNDLPPTTSVCCCPATDAPTD